MHPLTSFAEQFIIHLGIFCLSNACIQQLYQNKQAVNFSSRVFDLFCEFSLTINLMMIVMYISKQVDKKLLFHIVPKLVLKACII